ncbi:MAG TPA: zinc ribbon domain-containing protein [Candidatus Sulfotelmatobacter sp.]|nr:zinc ribbon domain-containing protein [Candidatus Sulfotelmatobacter sp.]
MDGFDDESSNQSRNGILVPEMTGRANPGRVCPSCGTRNLADAKLCSKCGASLEDVPDSSQTPFADDDPALRYVDPENRVELERHDRLDDAEIACGFLRANGIACELSSMVLGLPGELILWVHAKDARVAWALLADAERESLKDDRGAA